MSKTIFSKIIDREIPASIVYEDELVCAILDIRGVNPGHSLVISKTPIASVTELPSEIVSRMILVGQKIARAMLAGAVSCESVNFLINDGPAAGQEVPHCHLHVIPRKAGDSLEIHHDAEPWSEEKRLELENTAKVLSAKIQSL